MWFSWTINKFFSMLWKSIGIISIQDVHIFAKVPQGGKYLGNLKKKQK